ncbi:hypothetical protein HK097_005888, partial [Rhizophlyctis rosea]
QDFEKDASYDAHSPFAHPTNGGAMSPTNMNTFQKQAFLMMGSPGQRSRNTLGPSYIKYGGDILAYAKDRREEFLKTEEGKEEVGSEEEMEEVEEAEDAEEEEGRKRKPLRKVEKVGKTVPAVGNGEEKGVDEGGGQ